MGRIDNAIDFLFRTLKGRLIMLVCTAFIATMCSGCFLFSCPACFLQQFGCDTCDACASCFIECDEGCCNAKYDSDGKPKDDGCCSDNDSNDDGCCSDSPEPTVTFNITLVAYDSNGNYIETITTETKNVKSSAVEDIKTVPYWNDEYYATFFKYDSAYTGFDSQNHSLSKKIAGANGSVKKDSLKNKRTIYVKLVEKAVVGEEYTINFYEPNSTNMLLDSIAVEVGSPVTNFPSSSSVPTEEGFVFQYWALNNGLNSGLEFRINNGTIFHPYKNRIVGTFEIDLYPIYHVKLYTLSVAVGDNSSTYSYIQHNELLKEVIGDVDTNIYDDKVFKGWAFSEENFEAKIIDLTSDESLTYRITRDMHLYAVYADRFNLTLHNIKGPNVDVTDEVLVTEGGVYTFTDPVCTQGPYGFAGWYTSPDFDQYTSVPKTIDITGTTARNYYAKWEEVSNNQIIYFGRVGNADIDSEHSRVDYTYNADEATPLLSSLSSDWIPTGYTFNGDWSKDSADGDQLIWKALPAGTYGIIELHAVYLPETYQVLLYPDGGSIAGMTESGGYYRSDVKYSERKQFPVPTKEGYVFDGWFHRNTETRITDASGLMTAPHSSANGLVLEAHWRNKTYTVKFVDANGINYVTPSNVEHGKTVPACPISTPSAADGYEFDYWEDQAGNAYSPSTTVTGDITYTAKYKPKGYTITLKLPSGATFSDGSTEKQVQVIYKQTGIELVIPDYPDGWLFEGWKREGYSTVLVRATIDGNGNTVCVLNEYNFTSDIVLVAVFTV